MTEVNSSMPKSYVISMLVLAVLGGFVGGILSRNWPTLISADKRFDEVLTTREVRVLDSKGNLIARLGSDATYGGGKLELNGPKAQVQLAASDSHGDELILKHGGQVRVDVCAHDVYSYLQTFDAEGKPQVCVGNDDMSNRMAAVSPDGKNELIVGWDEEGTPVLKVWTTDSSQPLMSLRPLNYETRRSAGGLCFFSDGRLETQFPATSTKRTAQRKTEATSQRSR